MGFITDQPGEEKKWYNVEGDPVVLKELMKNIVSKGNTIEFEYENNKVGTLTLIKAAEKTKTDDMNNFDDLLSDAHEKYPDLLSIRTELIDNNWKDKCAIVKATVEIKGLGTFTAYGDSTQENCGDIVKKHWIRMAETRAIARALRWATNNAATAKEETEESESH